MTDPTIPEIVARLRELHAKLQALQVGTPEFTAARQLFRDVLQLSAPAILDALDHVGDANKMVRGIPMTDDGLEWIERLDGSLDLFRAGSGANLATVYTDGTWFTWDANGTGGENGKAPDVETAKVRAIKALVRQPRSPDGVEVDGPGPLSSDGVCPFCNCYADTPHTWRDCAHDLRETNRGLRERADRVTLDFTSANNGLREHLAQFRLKVCEALGCTKLVHGVTPEPFTVAASDDVALAAIRGLRERTTWHPISEPPSAEVHAWCGGWYLLRHDDGELCPEHWDSSLPWEKWSSGHREYTPIPPSDERRG